MKLIDIIFLVELVFYVHNLSNFVDCSTCSFLSIMYFCDEYCLKSKKFIFVTYLENEDNESFIL